MVDSCDSELIAYSDSVNRHGAKQVPEQVAEQMRKCSLKRNVQLAITEQHCGPAQKAFGDCLAKSPNDPIGCKPLIENFLDCAQYALDEHRKQHT
eukprot:CAMPEP_0198198426 /NCGR_PEP_ID=MMETSP1445-20131203/1905_1 /TAXON_ID=36898 /ORGANISM="Pyramimonas sp., Strain CCMP2087" /LENGTH=94 /DNA_ID=CAMNT_0043867991 /DNA_START=310 /DNA_END=594 /DNA_ORIENTATION=-